MIHKHDDNTKLDQVLQLLIEASNDKKMDLKQYVSKIYENIKSAEEQTLEKVKEAAVVANKHVHDKAWIYVGAAALGGLLIGFLCHRRK